METAISQRPQGAKGVAEFCEGHGISRAYFYVLQRLGKGPRVMRVGRRTLVSDEAAAEWRRRMECDTNSEVA